MKPTPRPVRFAAHVESESQLQDELRAWLERAVESEGSAAAVSRKMGVNRITILRLRQRQSDFSLDTAFKLAKAYPDV